VKRALGRSWWWYGAAGLGLLLLVSWLTALLLRLDADERAARQQAALHERLRLGLWRLDSWLGPRLLQEALRPASDYRAFPRAPAAWNAQRQKMAADAVVPSPLLGSEPSLFPLHFMLGPEDVSSPQVPAPADLELCSAIGIDQRRVERAAMQLRLMAPGLSWLELRQRLAIAEAALPTLGSGSVAPTANEPATQSLNELSTRQRAAVGNYNATQSQLADQPARDAAANAAPAVGPLVPLWLEGDGAALVIVRRARLDVGERIQGVLVGWAELNRELLALVADLFSSAQLVRCEQPTLAEQPSMLASIPVRLVATVPPLPRVGLPLGWILGTAWAVTLLALAVLGFLLRAAVGYGQRRARFASAVTHELRTPLTTFRMYSEMLADDIVQEPAARQQYLRTLQHESDRLARVVENVLAWSRLEEGRFAARRQPHTVPALVEHARGPLQRRLAAAGMAFACEVAPELAESVLSTDDEAIGQILFNLVDNAAKYAAAGGRVELIVQPVDRGVQFAVRDFGPGVPASVRQRIFAPFDRGAIATGDNDQPGVGLGLALARGLARDLGGELRLGTVDGPGACFVLALPLAD
jgi:signal transduction histidine kinase